MAIEKLENMENYEEKYKTALANAEFYHKETTNTEVKNWLEYAFPELRESEDERIRKAILHLVKSQKEQHFGIPIYDGINWLDMIAWLEKQGEQIQWKGNNLKEIVEFTGKSPKFNDWFKTWEEYENYVHTHNNIFKIFNEDGSHVEVPVGAWIIKTPDGYNVASRYVFKQKSADKVEPKFKKE